ncbi:MAG TPA: HAD family hydrolase [Rectinemataceae bacterium]|nr:HAD family hydrolase [Rectinemataceae bacterium]
MKNGNFRYIALDMDGTILDKNYALSPAVRDTLIACRELGKKVIISTGRVFASANKHLAALGGADGFVCSNGADVYDNAGVLISQTHMDDALSRMFVALARANDSHFHAFIGDSWYYEREKAYTQFYIKRSGLEGNQVNFDNFERLGFTKCMFLDDHEKLETLRERIEKELAGRAQLMYSAPFMLEVVVNGVSKSSGLRSCVGHWGGSLDEVIAFGDAGNDEDMLLAAGFGVAMGNASDELKAKVDAVAPSVDEDGVAVFLKSFFDL